MRYATLVAALLVGCALGIEARKHRDAQRPPDARCVAICASTIASPTLRAACECAVPRKEK